MNIISTVIKNILALGAVGISGVVFYSAYMRYENPCSLPLTYKVETFDSRFGITQQAYVNAIHKAVSAWEDNVGVDLFAHDPESGRLHINLLYDNRQQATTKLGTLDSSIENSSESYDAMKLRYDMMISKYNADVKKYEADRNAYETSLHQYQADVTYWNNKGGAPESTYKGLMEEKKKLANDQKVLDAKRQTLNVQVNEANVLAEKLNILAKNVNKDISQYNTIGGSIDSEFDQGVYQRDESGERINIYQFDDMPALIHVLTHELGHSLDVEHSENQESIMYYLHKSNDQKVTPEDVLAVKEICRIK